MVRLFWLIIFAWLLFRGFLLFLAWKGDQKPESRERVLKYFNTRDLEKGREYALNGFWAKVFAPLPKVAILLLLVLAGYSLKIYNLAEKVAGGNFWLSSLVYYFVFFAIMQIASLPFSYYLGFVCEKQMGFSNMTQEAWFLRYAKTLLISGIFQYIGIVMVIWVLKTFPRIWPLLVPFSTTLFSIVITIIFPIVITPLFYNQKPLAEGPLRDKILEIAQKSNIPVEGIFEIDESRYSNHTNAYFTGVFGKKRIVLFDTLIKSHTTNEAALIFAHEVGHWIHDHVLIGLTLGFLGTLCGSFFLMWVFPIIQAEPAFGLKEIHSVANIPFFILLFMTFGLFFAPIEAQISQHFERQADRASLELTGLSKVFIDAEVRLARDNLADLLPHPIRVFCLYSHPPAIKRIESALAYQTEKAP